MRWLFLALAIVLNASANILIKAAMRSLAPASAPGPLLLRAAFNPWLLGGLLCFGLALGGYSYTLTRFPLSVAYPIMTSLGLILVAAASVLFFQEGYSTVKLVGTLLIIGGVVLVGTAA